MRSVARWKTYDAFQKILIWSCLKWLYVWLSVAVIIKLRHCLKIGYNWLIECPVRASRCVPCSLQLEWTILCHLNDSLDRSKGYHQLFPQPFLRIFFLGLFYYGKQFRNCSLKEYPKVGKRKEITSSRIETKVPDGLVTLTWVLVVICFVVRRVLGSLRSVISFLCQNRNSPY